MNCNLNLWAFLVAQVVRNLPAMQETWVKSLGQEDPLEKEMATRSSILGPAVQEIQVESLGWEKALWVG